MPTALLGRVGALLDDPIVAVATPRGRGAVGIVRVSGPSLSAVCRALLGRELARLPDRCMVLCTLRDGRGEPLDRVLAVRFAAPRSYTGEDVLELHLHGNPVLLDAALEAAVAAGARLAEPGEYTRRALGHGKLSLLDAEAIDALIRAPSRAAARMARRQLDGELLEAVRAWRGELVGVAVALEALVDFPEDIDPEEVRPQVLELARLVPALDRLAASAEAGRRLLDGVGVVLAGPTNAGKSTLLNSLLGRPRALVSPVPGTTRDTVSESVEWGGVTYRLEDTAGVRETNDPVEAAGIARALAARERADVVVFVRDARELAQGGVEALPESFVRVASHADHAAPPPGWIGVDARRAEDAARVRDALMAVGGGAPGSGHSGGGGPGGDAPGGGVDEALLHSARQRHAVIAARDEVAQALRWGPDEPVLCAVAVRAAGRALQELSGEWTDEGVLDALFERFCVGK